MKRALAALALILSGQAMAQTLDEGVRFTLKPRPGRLILRASAVPTGPRARMTRLGRMPLDQRTQEVEILFRRQKHRLVPDDGGAPFDPPLFAPRSRSILLMVENRQPLSDHVSAMIGFQGAKFINHTANVTAIGRDDGLRVKNWFMPRAAIAIAPAPDLTLSIGYGESLRGYGETGHSGPLGLPREEFRALARNLQPERHQRLRLDAGWNPSPDLTLALTAYHGRISDRLAFLDRSYLPRNGGSADLDGAAIAISHRLSRRLRWSMRYGEARVGHARERRLAVEAGWTSDRLSATLRATRSSMAALLPDPAGAGPALRIEGEMRYQFATPAFVLLRLSNPDRLASTALLRNDVSGAVGAADQARGLTLGMGWHW